MKTLALILTLAGIITGRHIHTLQSELDDLNRLSVEQLIANIDLAMPGALNAHITARMDGRELLGAALDNLACEGADADDIAEAIAEVREGAQQ